LDEERRNGRLLIFGWDGADWAVIEEGWRLGRLSALRSVVERGQSGTLLSTVPPITSVAWTSFLTGRDPGEHGIFGFRAVDPETYRLSPVPGGSRQVPTLMEVLDRAGYRTALVTVPWTYPADRLRNGAIVPGWDAPDEGWDSSHPPEIARELADAISRVPRRGPRAHDAQNFLRQQAENLELRERISSFLIERTDPAVFMVVFSEPDQGAHHLWEGEAVPPALVDAYDQVDATMGRILDRWGREDDTILIVSDHGSSPLHTLIHIGQLLSDGGWLVRGNGHSARAEAARGLKRNVWYRIPPRARKAAAAAIPMRTRRRIKRSLRSTSVDWAKTLAFPVGSDAPGIGVQINLNPPFASGSVTAETYAGVRNDLAEYLRRIRDPATQQPVFDRVAFKEEVYRGPAVDRAPDLLLLPRSGYGIRTGLDFSGWLSRVAVGEHRSEGIYAVNRQIGLERTEHIEGVLPKVLSARGFPVRDASLEGQSAAVATYGHEEAQEIESRLRDLGYIE